MKTLYFLEPGQKLNDIKPSERKRALLITNQEWSKFGDHLVRNQRKLEAAEREKEEMQHRTAQSKEMAKTWENTIIVSTTQEADPLKCKLNHFAQLIFYYSINLVKQK